MTGNHAMVEETILPLALDRKIGVVAYFIISHAAVTVARAGTSQAKHMLHNIGRRHRPPAERGDAQADVELVDSWPQVGGGGG